MGRIEASKTIEVWPATCKYCGRMMFWQKSGEPVEVECNTGNRDQLCAEYGQ